jgi:hypothetical protein
MLMTSASMREYFRDCLSQALKKADVRLSETAQVYVVNLLSEFGRSENLYAGTDAGEKPVLVELLSRAHEAEPQEAVRIYKHMGDSSLYQSGFFKESVNAIDYYVSMGGGAYASVADLTRATAATTSALFCELSDRFAELVELLDAMSLGGAAAHPKTLDDRGVLALVERFRRTHDRSVLETLKQHGIVLRPGTDDDDRGIN